ncbi:MAG: hypothetical protein WCS83_05410 [Endomicrobiia bacterium]|nr:hypothetical protein [Endomicrobiaceae bacterium]MDD3922738.1 hypothetical protein [Endomicrobiaceae bacterium]
MKNLNKIFSKQNIKQEIYKQLIKTFTSANYKWKQQILFHTQNGLHSKFTDQELTELMLMQNPSTQGLVLKVQISMNK